MRFALIFALMTCGCGYSCDPGDTRCQGENHQTCVPDTAQTDCYPDEDSTRCYTRYEGRWVSDGPCRDATP